MFPTVSVTITRIKNFLEDFKNAPGKIETYANTKELKYEPPKKKKEKLLFNTLPVKNLVSKQFSSIMIIGKSFLLSILIELKTLKLLM